MKYGILMFFLLTAIIYPGPEANSQNLHKFSDNNSRFGYKDDAGNIILLPQYIKADEFSEGLAGVNLNGKWGFIDKTGKEVIPFKYDVVHEFLNGLTNVGINNKYGYINNTGKEITQLKYDDIYYFSQDRAIVKLNNKFGFINKEGLEIIPLKYDDVYGFTEGLAAMKINNKWGFIDKSGKEIISPQYDKVNDNFHEDSATVTQGSEKFRIDKTGKGKGRSTIKPYEGCNAFNILTEPSHTDCLVKFENDQFVFMYHPSWKETIFRQKKNAVTAQPPISFEVSSGTTIKVGDAYQILPTEFNNSFPLFDKYDYTHFRIILSRSHDKSFETAVTEIKSRGHDPKLFDFIHSSGKKAKLITVKYLHNETGLWRYEMYAVIQTDVKDSYLYAMMDFACHPQDNISSGVKTEDEIIFRQWAIAYLNNFVSK